MRTLIVAALALAAAACAYNPTRYDEDKFETASNANPIDRGTEFLRQIRNAEIEAEKQRASEQKKPPKLFKNQKDEDEEKGDGA